MKGDNISSVNMVRQFAFNIYSMLVDVNKDLISFKFPAFLDRQSIRHDEATTFKELILFNALADVPITSPKT